MTAGGLAPALEQLAERAAIPVEVNATPERYPDEVESTAYFVASEALANVAKYANAQHAQVTAERRNGRLTLAISDDGVGGADATAAPASPASPTAWQRSNGQLRVESPEGRGNHSDRRASAGPGI